ncbi:MAG: hypothetical protein Q4C20_16130 [Erysipelotrichaceae bacterium]|nr:hypothetical protein [Erysipelotrichaceae bacterium]
MSVDLEPSVYDYVPEMEEKSAPADSAEPAEPSEPAEAANNTPLYIGIGAVAVALAVFLAAKSRKK